MTTTPDPWDVIVVGAGLAGLVAARDLAAQQLSVAVFEARGRVGGRTWSRTFPGTDTTVDLGAEWVEPTQHTALVAEYDRYGIELLPATGGPSEKLWLLDGERLSGELPLDGTERAAFDAFMAELADAARKLTDPSAFASFPGGEVPFAERLEQLPPRVASVLSVFATSVMGALPSEVSVAGVLDDLAGTGDEESAGSAQRRVKGGTGLLADRIAATFGARLFTEAVVTAVAQDADGVVVTLADGSTHRARALVCAIPVNTLTDVAFDPELPSDIALLAKQKHAGRAVKVVARVSGIPDDAAAGVWPPAPSGVIGIGSAAPGSDDSLAICFGLSETIEPGDPDALTGQLRRVYPDARVVEAINHDWNADPYARGAWFAPKPGQWPLLAAFLEPHGRVVFAGSDISPVSLGYMDGAVLSARAAADRVHTILND